MTASTSEPGDDQTLHNQATYDRIAEPYLARQLRHRAEGSQGFDNFERTFLDAIPPGGLIGDLGCGPALDGSRFVSERGMRAVGLDRSRGMLALAPSSLRGRIAQADLRRLALAPGALNDLWCCAAFLHVPESDTSLVLAEFRRILHPDRLALITAMGVGSRFESVEYRPGERRWCVYRAPDELRREITDVGFEITLEERIDGNRDWFALLCRGR